MPGATRVLPVADLLARRGGELSLLLLAGARGLGRSIRQSRIQKLGLALAGDGRCLRPGRVHVLGQTESDFLQTLDPATRRERVQAVCRAPIACLIVTKGLPVSPELMEAAEREGLPLLRSPLASHLLIRRVAEFLEEVLAEEKTVHGSLVDVFGVGILLLGKSGIGKSECALALVERGHRLVADDLVVVRKGPFGALVGFPDPAIAEHMEIRGLGIINIKDLYGVSSTRPHKRIGLVIDLVEWTAGMDVERVGLEEHAWTLMEISLPRHDIPVRPGRDLSLIVEVAARNRLLRAQGYHSARDLARVLSPAGTGKQAAAVDDEDQGEGEGEET